MKQLKCGLIGCGRIGCGFDDFNSEMILTHAGSYFNNPQTKLVALCDIDLKKLKKYGKKYNISSLYTNHAEMFKNENLDCISICTLVDSHRRLVEEAVANKIRGIFLEKPISPTLGDAKKIIEICKKNNTVLLIDHKRRFDPFYHSLKEFIKNGRLGKIQLINIYYGAGISNTCSHVFDIIRFLFGEIRSVYGTFSTNKSTYSNDPNIDVILQLDGFRCILQSVDLRFYGILEMDVLGTKGRLRVNMETNELQYFEISTKNTVVYNKLLRSTMKLKKSRLSNIQLGVKNLVGCVLSNERPLCTGEDGYKSLELIIAAIESANLQRKITLPLKSDYKISSK